MSGSETSQSRRVLDLCDRIWILREQTGICEGHPSWLEGTACLHAIEDTQRAIDAYGATDAFSGLGDAYLKKYGLLQAIQVQLDATERLAASVGTTLKLDKLEGVPEAIVARQVLAGHPTRSTVRGVTYRHFHDRGSILEPALLRYMSFSVKDPKNWTGATVLTSSITESVLDAVEHGLQHVIDYLVAPRGTRSAQ